MNNKITSGPKCILYEESVKDLYQLDWTGSKTL